MSVSPLFFDSFSFTHLGIKVDLKFSCNLTVIADSSASGKTFLWGMLAEESLFDSRIVAYNYTSRSSDILEKLKGCSGKLVVIDNADILLDNNTRIYIATDNRNQYLIMCRNPKYLFLAKESLVKVDFSDNTLYLKKIF